MDVVAVPGLVCPQSLFSHSPVGVVDAEDLCMSSSLHIYLSNKNNNKKMKQQVWHSSLVANLLILHARVSYDFQFIFYLLHFPFSSLLGTWESNGRRPKPLGPCTCMGDLE